MVQSFLTNDFGKDVVVVVVVVDGSYMPKDADEDAAEDDEERACLATLTASTRPLPQASFPTNKLLMFLDDVTFPPVVWQNSLKTRLAWCSEGWLFWWRAEHL